MSDVVQLADVVPLPCVPDPPPPGPRRRRSVAKTIGILGAVMLVILAAVAAMAPVLARHAPDRPSAAPYLRPSASHPLGTDDVGQDLFAQLLHGARVSLLIGLLAASIAVLLGVTVALAAGYLRGRVETVLMRLVDLVLAFPFFMLVVVLAAFFGRSTFTTVVVIGSVIWARPARVLRSQVIKIREFPHVTAARAMGASPVRVVAVHILPRLSPLLVAQFVRAANIAVLIEASLAFLGLGDTGRVSWGTTLYFANARSAFLTDAWVWWIVPPGLALTWAIVAFAFVGTAVEEWADPRLARAAPRHAARRGRRRAASGPIVPVEGAPLLEVRDLIVRYRTADDPVVAVDGVSFTVQSGRVVGVVGESGSGKSTMAMVLVGLLRRPTVDVEGTVLLQGVDVRVGKRARLAELRGRTIALVPQNAMNALNPAYRIGRQVAESASLTRDDPAEAALRAAEVLELVGIPADRYGSYPHELSGGMRQRVVIAMAIANEPALLVADEPATGLDVVTSAQVVALLLELRDRMGLAILLISHDLPLVARAADDLLVMHGGQVVERGVAAAVRAHPQHAYTRELLGAFPGLQGPRRIADGLAAGL